MPQYIQPKSILNKTRKRDDWFLDDYTVNPYSGCSFNCLFCYIRGSKYGEHMELKVSVKSNAVELLDKQLSLRAKKGQFGFIVLSSATDPYLHFEKEEQLTRRLLEVILKYRFPVHIITRSDLIQRDFDLLQDIHNQAILPGDLEGTAPAKTLITFSFNTLEDSIASVFEPGATPPSQRLKAVKASLEHGFYTGISLMPMLPFITDTTEQLEKTFSTFAETGVKYIMPATLSLYGTGTSDSKTLVLKAIEKHYPHLLEHYRGYFRQDREMPGYYKKAFYVKMKELLETHHLKNRIIDAH